MLTLKGKVLQIVNGESEFDGKKNFFKIVQVMTNGGDRMQLINVKDKKNREWQKGDQEIPVYVTAWVKGGSAMINYNAI